MAAITRRQLGLAGVALTVGSRAQATQTPEQPPLREAEALVVGAGIAGLRAAQMLRQKNLYVIVLEARERIGGRVWTDRSWENVPLDLGASWIHGITGNPLTALALSLSLKTLPTKYDVATLYNARGKPLPDSVYARLEKRLLDFTTFLKKVRTARQRLNQPDVSLLFVLERYLADGKLAEAEEAELQFALNTILEHEYAADISQLSLYHWDQDESFEGGDVLFPNGYDQIAQSLAKGLDIRTGQVVRQVAYDTRGVRITTTQGEFKAKRAIITLPLGVLQRGSVLFTPALPDRKRAAIRALGMGVLNKLYLSFPNLFWPEESQLIGNMGPTRGAWAEFYNFAPVTGKPVLLGFNAGDYGYYIEGLSDAQIVADALETLRRMFGKTVPEPAAFRLTRWASDPFAFGSYSYLPPGATGTDRDALAEPVANRLFFAGEATHRQYPATVHGALLSGERAAKRILAL
jgi:monoamine oxidase